MEERGEGGDLRSSGARVEILGGNDSSSVMLVMQKKARHSKTLHLTIYWERELSFTAHHIRTDYGPSSGHNGICRSVVECIEVSGIASQTPDGRRTMAHGIQTKMSASQLLALYSLPSTESISSQGHSFRNMCSCNGDGNRLVSPRNSQSATVSKCLSMSTLLKSGTHFIKCSINVCKLTSSVNVVCAVCDTPPYVPELVCVVEGFNFESRKRACDPPASQTIHRGSGKRSVISSCSPTS